MREARNASVSGPAPPPRTPPRSVHAHSEERDANPQKVLPLRETALFKLPLSHTRQGTAKKRFPKGDPTMAMGIWVGKHDESDDHLRDAEWAPGADGAAPVAGGAR